MDINWFTVGAQIFNFLILVFLLKKFLYKPVLNAIEQREEKIARLNREASLKLQEAEEKKAEHEEELSNLKKEKEKLYSEAKEEVEKERLRLLKEVRTKTEETKRKWQASINEERESFIVELRRQMGEEVCRVARLVLEQLADVKLEEKVLITFLKKLDNISDNKVNEIRKIIKESGRDVTIVSAFVISKENQESIAETLKNKLNNNIDNILYQTSPDLICGIELQVEDYIISWHIKDYLKSMEKEIINKFKQVENYEEIS